MLTASTRRSLLAFAGVTAGITSLVATGTPAVATPTDPAPDTAQGTWLPPDAKEKYTAPPAGALFESLPACTDFRDFLPDSTIDVWVPTTADGNGNCVMGPGNQGNAVGKLQLAIRDCYPGAAAIMGPVDKIYGDRTARAVSEVQRIEGVRRDGIYGPETKNAMVWPGYQNGRWVGCRPLV
jgi:peptidoglycan hydrolase-like protein with peptidoglycan-binding domain